MMLQSSIHTCCGFMFRMGRAAGAEQEQTGHQDRSGAQVFSLAFE